MSKFSKFQVKKATRVSKPLRLFVSGVPGAGKTYTSLLLASGLTSHKDEPRVLVFDTECGRASLNVGCPGIPQFDVVDWNFREQGALTNQDYIDFMHYAAEEYKPDIVIIDSITQQWDALQELVATGLNHIKNDMAKWKRAKAENMKFMNEILYCPFDIIVTCRSKVKTIVNPDTRKPEVAGEGAQIESNMPYVFDFVFYIDRGNHGVTVEKVPPDLASFITHGTILDKDTGLVIREWLDKGVDPQVAKYVALIRQRFQEFEDMSGSPHDKASLDFYSMTKEQIIAIGKEVSESIKALQ